jgi:prepilin-type N-terminal cleavage/methylation domain-containing protein
MSESRIKKYAGFTLVEMLVVVSIVTLVGGAIFTNFRSGQRESDMRETASDIASMLRRAQGAALSGLQYRGASTLGYQVSFDFTTNTYSYCPVLASAPPGSLCPASTTIETRKPQGKVRVVNAQATNESNAFLSTSSSVVFKQPYGDISFIKNDSDAYVTNGLITVSVMDDKNIPLFLVIDVVSGKIDTTKVAPENGGGPGLTL